MTAQRLVSSGVTYQTISRFLAPGKTEVIDCQGNFVRCLSANAPFALGVDGAPPQYFAKFIAFRLPGNAMFSQITVDNSLGAQTLIYKLAIGQGQVSDDRAGSFPPLDDATLAAQCFIGTIPGTQGGAAFSNQVAFLPINNVLFGAFVRQLIITSTIADVIQFGLANAALGDVVTPQKSNKVLAFTAPTLVLSQASSAINVGNLLSLFQIPVQANIPFVYTPPSPLIIIANGGLGLFPQTVASKLSVTWDWHEVPAK